MLNSVCYWVWFDGTEGMCADGVTGSVLLSFSNASGVVQFRAMNIS